MKAANMSAIEREKPQVEAAKLKAETDKLKIEARKYAREMFWQPVGIALAFFAAVATVFGAIAALIVKLII